MQSLEAFAVAKLEDLAARGLERRPIVTHRRAGGVVERDGRRLISFCCNDYLGLSHHPAVKAAAMAAVETYGAGAAASRLVTGDHPLLSALEARLARLKGTEAACVFGSGYLANTGIIPTLVGPGDLVLLDAFSHACQMAGAQISGAKIQRFPHNDAAFVAKALAARTGGRALVATDGVFSMDGDVAPLEALSAACEASDAWLLVDDAHGVGVLGDGRGAVHASGVTVPLQMGTLSKAVGGYGGYLCASGAVIDLMKSRARTLVYSTGLPPAAVGAAVAALEIIEAAPSLCAAPLRKARLFTEALGLPPAQSAIVPVIVGAADDALADSARLAEQGFLVTAIRPPTVPTGAARLRVTFSAVHEDADILRLADAVRALEHA
jgi:8-amino-7-oxononanoate synthase